jgi:hypothetical protein
MSEERRRALGGVPIIAACWDAGATERPTVSTTLLSRVVRSAARIQRWAIWTLTSTTARGIAHVIRYY